MISAEVPIMFSKAIEIFITELSLRAWLHTEEAKRRTVQVIDRQTDRQTEIQQRQTTCIFGGTKETGVADII